MCNSIVNQIPVDLKNAMLSKAKVEIATLRAVKSAFLLENTKEGSTGEISDEVALQLISKLYKQRMDAHAIYIDQNREDLAEEEALQAKILEKYLPKQLTEEEVREELKLIVAQVGATSMSDMGKVMGKAMGKLKGKADGAVISKLVKEVLN
jgi:uncharacterized protein YqeY